MCLKKYEELIKRAYSERFAIPQFNINNLEWAKYILEECEEQKSPVFLGVSTGAAKYMGGYNTVVQMVRGLIKDLNIKVPVMLHLDHAKTYVDCKMAYEAGFNSLMIDASLENVDDNIIETNKVSEMASDALIEAEIGKIGGTEDDMSSSEYITTTEEASNFCNQVNIDMLAPALGSVHGHYKGEPNIRFDVMKEISKVVDIPLVLHGGSGLSSDIVKKCVESGVVKVNFNTELQVAWNKAVREFIKNNSDVYDPRKIISAGENALKTTVREYINILNSQNKG